MEPRMKSLKAVFVAVLAAFAILPIASAQSSDPARYINSITKSDLSALITGYGHTILSENPDTGALVVQAGTGFQYIALMKNCDAEGACGGVLIGSLHEVPEGLTWQLLNQVDSRADMYGLYIMNDSLIVDRYIRLDGGVDIAQIQLEIVTLTVAAPQIVQSIAQLSTGQAG